MQNEVRIVDGWELSIKSQHTLAGRKYYVIGRKYGKVYWFHATQSHMNALYYLNWVDPNTAFRALWI